MRGRPRGVGFAVVSPQVQETLVEPPTLAPTHHTGVRRWESQEAHVAGRVGLAVAALEWEPGLLPLLQARAATARRVLDGVATADGEVAHTACVGFGLERIALALYRRHGFDRATWSPSVRGTLGL